MLSCTNLIIQRAGKALTQPLGFTLLPGAILHISGANGAGKSTLLQMIAGLIPAPAQTISFAGQCIQSDLEYRAEVAMLGHQHGLWLNDTVLDNLNQWASLYGEPSRIDAAINFWQLENVKHKAVQELSAGWRQRVALARMMLKSAVIWLLDEPTSHLDVLGRELLWKLIATRANHNGIVVFTSHDAQIPIGSAHHLSLSDWQSEHLHASHEIIASTDLNIEDIFQ